MPACDMSTSPAAIPAQVAEWSSAFWMKRKSDVSHGYRCCVKVHASYIVLERLGKGLIS